MTTLEIAVTTLPEAIAAAQGGAHSIELSYDLQRGGLTPSLELVTQILEAITVDVHVIVRPTDRDFVYTPAEVDLILRQTREIAALGVTGLVFGAHTPAGTLDISLTRRVTEAAGKPVTLHRALDSAASPEDGLSQLVGVVSRVLTSGPAPNAWGGRHTLRRWVEQFGQHFDFIAAGTIRLEHIAELARYTGVSGCHVGSGAYHEGRIRPEQVQRLMTALSQK